MEQDIADFNKRKDEKTVSLNEEKLKAEREQGKKEELARYNKHRILKGVGARGEIGRQACRRKTL